jgi:hypothetical protein
VISAGERELIRQAGRGGPGERGGGTMHGVTWTYDMPEGTSPEAIRELFSQTADRYVGVPGLIRKYFGFSADARQVIGIYIWETRADAAAFYTPDWIEGVRSRWGSMPAKTEWEIPQIVESAQGRIVTADR